MKKLSVLAIFCLLGINITFAQEDCKICGDWKGAYQGPVADGGDHAIYGNIKYQIRIKKFGTDVVVRGKHIYPDGHTSYDEDNVVLYVDEGLNNIVWSRTLDSYNEQDVIEGHRYNEEHWSARYSAKLSGGRLIVHSWTHVIYTYGNTVVYEQDLKMGSDYTLYREDDDW